MKILVADLRNRRCSYMQDEALRRDAIGGVGLTTTLLNRHTSRGIDPFDEGNHLFFAAGAFAGTTIPTASRCEMTALSPLSNYFGTASGGGMLGGALRFSGLDGVWIRGTSEKPVYLVVDCDKAEFKDAADLWGQDTYAALDVLKAREGRDTETAVIGTAGERKVRFASIQNGYHHSFGRTGLGAVMGAKRLKAVCFRGAGHIPIHDRKRFRKVQERMRQRVCGSSTFGYTRRFGSMVVSDVYDRMGVLPGRNFTAGSIKDWAATRGRKVFEEQCKERGVACLGCPVGCMHWSSIKQGQWAGFETKGVEVTYVLELGAKLGLPDFAEIIMCGEACNRTGIDVISASSVIAYAIELFDKGSLREKDFGFRPRYGDFASIHKCIMFIAEREGIGEILAEGVKRARQGFGDTDGGGALEIKGVEVPVRDPRGKFDSWILGYLTNTRGGDHLRVRTPVDDLKDPYRDCVYERVTVSDAEIADLDMPERVKKGIFVAGSKTVDIAAMTKYSEELVLLLNSVGMCIRPPVLRTIGPGLMAEGLNALYDGEMDGETLLDAAERLFNMQHEVNVERGMTAADFRFPNRFHKESLPYLQGEWPPLDKSAVDRLLGRYFSLRGWSKEGRIEDTTRERLGLAKWTNS